MSLIGGARPQLRMVRRGGWSKKRAKDFLTVLGETCNVTQACRESGLSIAVAYRRRKADAAFRAGWVEAVAAAYQRLELMLLERAFNGTEKVVTRRDGSEERMVEYSDRLGLTLLRMHRDTADTDHSPEEIDEVRERLIMKLRRLRERNQADAAQTSGEASDDMTAGE